MTHCLIAISRASRPTEQVYYYNSVCTRHARITMMIFAFTKRTLKLNKCAKTQSSKVTRNELHVLDDNKMAQCLNCYCSVKLSNSLEYNIHIEHGHN